ncbi:hypothetical protein BGX34_011913 [Mortierella sp. NVP85]|nr:hypothetical protein BGX34_011913 [Mortierella sp. NVP85]
MAPKNPLEIQEIMDLVASYVEIKDATTCIRVSKGWYDSFLPHVWRIVRAGISVDDYGVDHPIGPKRDTIDGHRHLIQELTLVKTIGAFNKYHYPNMRRLVIDMNESKPHHSRLFMNLTTKAPMLVDLTLTGGYVPSIFWIALSKHPHLKRLSLAHLTFQAEDALRLWRTCMNLESLQMRVVSVERRDRPPRNMVFDRLRQLKYIGTTWIDGSFFLDIVIQSPRLESLELIVYHWIFFDPPTAIGDWPCLKKVFIAGWKADTNMDFIFKRVEQGQQNTVGVEGASHSGLGTPQASMVFGSNFNSLVDVDLLTTWTTSRSTIPDLLCLCPILERLRAKTVFARSVAERGDWVCRHLRDLRIQFVFDEEEQDLQPLMFERLSTLVRLERLTLNYDYSSHRDTYYGVLECRLDRGLGRLANLQQLASFWLYTPKSYWRNPHLGMEEVEWILENWKKLETIKGKLTDEEELGAQLWDVFESHGIAVEKS